MAITKRQEVLRSHGINMRVAANGHTEACGVSVDCHGMVSHEWVDVDVMTFASIYEWLGY